MSSQTDLRATLVVVDPNGRSTRVPLDPFPFRIGRSPDNNLVLRDSRVSRNHAQITFENGTCYVEDPGSMHGVWVNGARVDTRCPLVSSDKIEFGVPDGFQIHFTRAGDEMQRLLSKANAGDTGRTGTANLEKLRAVLEVARSLQSSFSPDDILNTVVDAALTATGAERGFLLLFNAARELEVRSARGRSGADLPLDDLRVPRKLIQRALESRRDLFSMSFDPDGGAASPGNTVSDLDLCSVVCVPLVRVSLHGVNQTQVLATARESTGVLYLDSRAGSMDLAGGNRELLQTLAIEASTVLENARLLEEEREKRKMQEELSLARRIQQGLLPCSLPGDGWFQVCGSSEASHQVGGDYYDVIAFSRDRFSTVIADVSGKGVGAALLASFLQGALLSAQGHELEQVFARVNRFLHERSGHGKYATVFYSTIDRGGNLTFVNAGHCAPLLVHSDGAIEALGPTATPVGLIADAVFPSRQLVLRPGDKMVLYTDGVTEAQNEDGEFFGRKRLRAAVTQASHGDCAEIHAAIQKAVHAFSDGTEQNDDITLLCVEFRG